MSKFLTAIEVGVANGATESQGEYVERVVRAWMADENTPGREAITYTEALEYFVSYGIGRVAALARAKAKGQKAKEQAKIVVELARSPGQGEHAPDPVVKRRPWEP